MNTDANLISVQKGITLRDYYAAHAPHEPASWFQPVFPPRPVSVYISEDGNTKFATAGDAEKICGERYHDIYQNEVNEWKDAKIRARAFQWPGAWADGVIAEMKVKS